MLFPVELLKRGISHFDSLGLNFVCCKMRGLNSGCHGPVGLSTLMVLWFWAVTAIKGFLTKKRWWLQFSKRGKWISQSGPAVGAEFLVRWLFSFLGLLLPDCGPVTLSTHQSGQKRYEAQFLSEGSWMEEGKRIITFNVLRGQDDLNVRNWGLSKELLLLSAVEVVAEKGRGRISKVHVSNRRKKDLQSKYAVAFAEFLELQTRLLRPACNRAPESWRWHQVLSPPQANWES